MEKIKNKQCKTCKSGDYYSFENFSNAFWGGGCSNNYKYPCKDYKPTLIGKICKLFYKKEKLK